MATWDIYAGQLLCRLRVSAGTDLCIGKTYVGDGQRRFDPVLVLLRQELEDFQVEIGIETSNKPDRLRSGNCLFCRTGLSATIQTGQLRQSLSEQKTHSAMADSVGRLALDPIANATVPSGDQAVATFGQ